MKLLDYVNEKWGKRASLARALGVSNIMLSLWALGRKAVPAHRCIEIEKITGGLVRCEEMRPDIDWSVLRNSKK